MPPDGWPKAMKVSLALLALALAATACAGDAGRSLSPPMAAKTSIPVPTQPTIGPFASDAVGGLVTATDIAYTAPTDCGGTPCTVPGDVLARAGETDLPTILLLGGGSTPFANRRYQQPLAPELAQRGAVVFLMSYRSAATGNYDSDSANDVRCAVRYARDRAEEYGGDPDRIIVVGHSQGGFLSVEVAIQPEQEAEACLADGSGKPDGVVGLGSPLPSFAGAGDSAPPMWLFAGSLDTVNAEGSAATT